MNKDTIAGTIQQKGGKARAKINHAIGSEKGEAHGLMDEAAGTVRKAKGKIKDALD